MRCLHEYVFIENEVIINENATTVLHLHIVFISFSAVYTKTMKTTVNWKTSGNVLFACQDSLSNLWLLLHRSQKFTFPVKRIHPSIRQRYHYDNIVFKSFHFGDRFQKLSFSVKMIIVFDRFRADGR